MCGILYADTYCCVRLRDATTQVHALVLQRIWFEDDPRELEGEKMLKQVLMNNVLDPKPLCEPFGPG